MHADFIFLKTVLARLSSIIKYLKFSLSKFCQYHRYVKKIVVLIILIPRNVKIWIFNFDFCLQLSPFCFLFFACYSQFWKTTQRHELNKANMSWETAKPSSENAKTKWKKKNIKSALKNDTFAIYWNETSDLQIEHLTSWHLLHGQLNIY